MATANANLLGMPRAVFYDFNGNPLAGGIVHTYVPGGTTPKATWQDTAQVTLNSNPITLDSAGSAIIYGVGSYQFTTTDALGNAIAAYSGVTTCPPAISDAMAPVVAAATTSLGEVALGISLALQPTLAAATTKTAFGLLSAGVGLPLLAGVFGFVGDGATDNLAAWNAMVAVARLQSGGAAIWFAPGDYVFSAQPTFTYPAGRAFALAIEGYGASFHFPSSAGLQFTKSLAGHTLMMAGMHVTTGRVSGGIGVRITQSDPLLQFFPDSLRDVVFHGSDNNGHTGGSFYWTTALEFNNSSGSLVSGCTFYGGTVSAGLYGGNGINYIGTGVGGPTGPNYAIYHNIHSMIGNNLAVAVTYNAYAQGLTILQSNFQNTGNGFLAPVGVGGDLSQLQISDSQFACSLGNITCLTAIGNVMIANNDIFGVANMAAIFLNGTGGYTITGNTIAGASLVGSTGILVANNTGYPSTISANGVSGFLTGISCSSGSNNTIVSGNSISGCTNPIGDTGTNNSFVANSGLLPVDSSPAVGASPWLYTSGNRPEMLYLGSTGTIGSVLQQDGSAVLPVPVGANIPFSAHLVPHTTMSIVYTGTMHAAGTKIQ